MRKRATQQTPRNWLHRGWSYRAKVPLLIMTISLATALAISVTIAVSARQWLKEDLHGHATAVSQSLARALVVHIARDDIWEAFEAIRAVTCVEGGVQRCDVVVLDRHRRVFVSSDPARFPVGAGTTTMSEPLRQAQALMPSTPNAVVVDTRIGGESFSVVNVPVVSADGEVIGALLMSFSHAVFAARHADTVFKVALISLGFAALLLPLGWWLGHRMASPVARATESLYRLAQDASAKSSLHATATTHATLLPPLPGSEFERLEHSVAELQVQLRDKEQLQERFRALTELASVGIGSVDAGGMLTYVNERAGAIAGLPVERCLGDGWTRALHPQDRDRVVAIWRAAMAAGALYRDEFRFQHADGRVLHVIAEARPLAGDGGAPSGYVATLVDVTALKEIEQHQLARKAAEQANEAKSEFLARMSHELRTPLNAILGFAQLLQLGHGARLEAGQAEQVRQIRTAGEHLLEMINETLDLARIEAGKIALSIAPVPVAPLLAACAEVIQPLARQAGVALTHRVPADTSHTVFADPTRLRQIMLNLLSNAVKYNHPGGSVEVELRQTQERVAISVADSGLGLTAEQLSNLFQPFNRLGAERLRVEGTGIGLVIAKRLAQLMQGDLTVRSTSGEGSVFTVELPRASTAAPDASAALDGPAAHDGGSVSAGAPLFSVLYVEDNPSNATLVREIIAARPACRLRIAIDGERGLKAARECRPDLVLLDMDLPDMSGLAVHERLQADPATRDLPCIALSADAMPAHIAKAEAAGFVDYWIEPIDVARFLGMLDRMLAEHRRKNLIRVTQP